jgi:uncharacterized protein YukE
MYVICKKISKKGSNDTVVILQVSKENPKNFKLVKSACNGKKVYVKNVNEFHQNFGKVYKTLEEAKNALREILR